MTPRRSSRPVRVALAQRLGSDIDGAWWPRESTVAGELPELVSSLRPRVGEVEGIDVNWSATEGASDLHSVAMSNDSTAGLRRRPRLMRVNGSRCAVRLLVVPSLTSLELGTLVLRVAAGLAIREAEGPKECARWAQRVLAAARAESVAWTRQLPGGALAAAGTPQSG